MELDNKGLENIGLEDKLVIPALAVAVTGTTFHTIKLVNREFFPPITEYIGDFSSIFGLTALSGYAAIELDGLGVTHNLPILRKIADYLPKIVGGALATYALLGESVMDIIPRNTKDPMDIPAALLAACSGYVIGKYFYRKMKLN